MKKNFYLLSAALAALCLASCAKEQLANEEGNTPTGNFIEFSATTEGDDDADGLKTYISTPREDGSYAVRWSSGEAINVNGVKSAGAVVVDGSYNTKANFKVEMEPAGFYCAVSPYGLYSDKSFNAEAKTMDVFVKADAQYKTSDKEGKVITYDPSTALIAAYSATTELKFQHMMTYYQIKVTGKAEGKKIRKVTVSQNGSNPNIAGVYKLTFSDQGEIAMAAKNLTKTITYECGEAGIDLETPMMIALPSVKFTNGVTFTIYYTDGTSQAQFAKTLDLSSSRGKVVPADFPYREDTGVRTIKSAADWEAFAIAVQAANRENNPDSTALNHWLDNGVVTLAGDITLPGDFTRVANTFNNTFDGGGHTITIDGGKHSLFFTLGGKGIIRNLVTDGTMVDGSVDDGTTVLVNSLYGTIENCTNKTDITINKAMHMAVAPFAKIINSGVIKDCVNNGDITVTCDAKAADRNVYVGGIAARVLSSGGGSYDNPAVHLLNCTNTGNITVEVDNAGSHKIGYAGFGGIVGWVARNRSKFPVIKFEGCLNTGEVSVHNTYDGSGSDFATSVGGIAGLCWGDYYTDASKTETYHLGVPSSGNNQNKVFFLNCTNSGRLVNNTTSYCGTQKLWGKSYTGGIAGSVFCFDSVFSQEPVFDGCVSTGDVVPYSLTVSDRPGLESVAGGILGIGRNVTFKNCTVTATVGTTKRLAFAVGGVMGIAAGKFTVDRSSIYPHIIMGRTFITAQDNWGLITTYPVRSNTTVSFPKDKTKDTALDAVKVLFSGGALPSLEGSTVSNCQLGGEWIKLNAATVSWNSKNAPTLTTSKTKFNDLANCETNGVRGNNLKLNGDSTKLDNDTAYYGKNSGDVTFSGNTHIKSAPALTTAAPAPMALNAGNTYNY